MDAKAKGLLSNLGVFTLASFATKLLNYLLLPLYTSILSTGDYGTIDLVNTVVSLLLPILTLCISDAVLRFGISERGDEVEVLRVGLWHLAMGCLPMLAICGVYALATRGTVLAVVVFLLYVSSAGVGLLSVFAKALDKTREMAAISVATSAVSIAASIVAVACLRLGVTGCLAASVFGNVCGIVLYLTGCGVWRHALASLGQTRPALHHDMLAYSIPLVPNAVFWWINGSLDRWALGLVCGTSAVGLYAVASKLPSVIGTASDLFAQAWNLSLFQTCADEREAFFIRTYDIYAELLFCCTMGVIVLCKEIARLGFSGEFFGAWRLAPLLCAGAFVNALNSFFGSVFTANKKTRPILITTMAGALSNCVLNVPFALRYGGYGTAAVSLLSYLLTLGMRMHKVKTEFGLRTNRTRDALRLVLMGCLIVLVMSDRLWAMACWVALASITCALCRIYRIVS